MTDEPSGIVGNTIKAQNAGTKARTQVKENMMSIPRFTAMAVILIIFILLLTATMSIFWKLVSGVTLFYFGAKLGGVDVKTLSKEVVWKFPLILKVLGGIMIASTLLSSGISTKLDEAFTYADECLKDKCPDSEDQGAPSVTQASLCGPRKLVDGNATRAKPLRLNRDLACTIAIQKAAGFDAEIRYNDESIWLPWPNGAKSPTAKSLVKTFEVRPKNAGDTIYVVANFPRQR